MIRFWRQAWNERTNHTTDIQFPFGLVQVIPLMFTCLHRDIYTHVQLSTLGNTTNSTFYGYPWIRWHQTFDVGYVPNNVVPNVFMAVTLDLRDDPAEYV